MSKLSKLKGKRGKLILATLITSLLLISIPVFSSSSQSKNNVLYLTILYANLMNTKPPITNPVSEYPYPQPLIPNDSSEKVMKGTTNIVFTETFEGSFPGDNWWVGDWNGDGGDDYWDDTSYRYHSGSWSGWCADIGDNSYYGGTNYQNHKYDNNMDAFMQKKYVVDMSSWDVAYIDFYAWCRTESNFDYLTAIWYNSSTGYWYTDSDYVITGDQASWTNYVWKIPYQYMTSQGAFGFAFHSDSSICGYEGVYLDDIKLVHAEITVEPNSYVSPSSCYDGDTITLNYYIHNPTPFTLQCGLGATLYKYDVGEINDPAHDTVVTINPGYNWRSRSFTVPAGTPPGRYDVSYGLWSSMPGDISNGNRFWHLHKELETLTVNSRPKPDLIVENIWTSPEEPVGKATVTIYADITNQGGSTASNFDVEFWCDYRDSHGSQINLGTFSVSSLSPGSTTTVWVTTSAIGFGDHTLEVHADSTDVVDESDELNNWLWYDFHFRGPDLIVQDIQTTPESPTGGQTTIISAVIKNQGDFLASGFYVEFWCDYRGSYGSPSKLATVYVSSLDAGQTKTVSIGSSNIGFGNHILEVHVDSAEEIDEVDESNNWRWETFYFGGPDLVWTDIWTSPSQPTGGQSTTIYCQIKNQGDRDAVGTFRNYFYVDGSYHSYGDNNGLGTGSTFNWYWIGTYGPGYHIIEAQADMDNAILELNDGNNNYQEKIWWKGPDLVVVDIWWEDVYGNIDTTITSGQPFTIFWKIKNVGDADAIGTFRTELFIPGLGAYWHDQTNLAVGQEVTIERQLYLSDPGPYEIEANIDTGGVIAEANKNTGSGIGDAESNNNRIEILNVQKAKWTFMVYLDGDNDINDLADSDFSEMMAVGSSQDISIICLKDEPNFGDTHLFFIEHNGYLQYSIDPTDPLYIQWLDSEENMGSETTLRDFGNWATSTFQANHYILVVWNHGSGAVNPPFVGTVCEDWTNEDNLDIIELSNAMGYISQTTDIDILGINACLMGMVETAYQVRDWVDIMVASEETITYFTLGVIFGGWPYDSILNNLKSNPTMNPETLASMIVVEFNNSYNEFNSNPIFPDIETFTMGAFYISQISNELKNSINDFAGKLKEKMHLYHTDIEEAREATDNYMLTFDSKAPKLYQAYADLYDFVNEIIQRIPDSESDIQSAAQSVLDAWSSALINYCHGPKHPDSHGISIYWPNSSLYVITYEALNFPRDTLWDEFLNEYYHPEDHNTPPSISIVSPSSGDFWRGTQTIFWTGADANYDKVDYYIHVKIGNEWYHPFGLDPFTYEEIPTPTTHSVDLDTTLLPDSTNCYVRIDYDDGWGASGPIWSGQFTIDNTLPSTTCFLSGNMGNNGWYVSSVTVTLDPFDETSGIASTMYRINGGALQTYSGPFTISSDGQYIVEYYSVDKAGNIESTKSVSFKLDTTDPVTTWKREGIDGGYGWWVSDVTVELLFDESGSGVDYTKYRVNGNGWQTYTGPFEVSTQGVNVVEFYSVDKAGNVEPVNNKKLKIDWTPPTSLSILINDGEVYTNSPTVELTLSAYDSYSDVWQMCFSSDGVTWSSWEIFQTSKMYTLSVGDGAKTVHFKVRDYAGIESAEVYDTIILDTTGPTVSITSPVEGSEIEDNRVTVTWNGDDNLGINHYEVQLDGGGWIDTGPSTSYEFSSLSAGLHNVYVKVYDNAGNTATDSVSFTIILKIPSQLTDPSGSVAYGHSVSISTRLTDDTGNPISNRLVSFEIHYDGSWHSVGSDTTNSDGWASVSYTANLEPGDYSLKVSFAGDDAYYSSSRTGVLTVEKESTELVSSNFFNGVYTDTVRLVVQLRDTEGYPIEGRSVTFEIYQNIAWQQIGVGTTNSTGYAVLDWIVNLPPGTYDLNFSFAGDNYYLPSIRQSTLDVGKEIVVLGDPSTSVNYSDSVDIISRLTEDDGAAMADVTVSFYVYSGGSWSLIGSNITDGGGYATLTYTATLVPGVYDLMVNFSGDSYYYSGEYTGSLVVDREASVLSDPSSYVDFGDLLDVLVRLTDDDGFPIIGAEVLFRVHYDGAWHDFGSNTTNASGYARLIQPCGLASGDYNLEALFAGDQYYVSVVSTGTLSVGKEVTLLSDPSAGGLYNELIPIVTQLTDDENDPLGGLNVTFWVYHDDAWHCIGWDLTDINGYAQLDYLLDLVPGNYPLRVNFQETSNYLASEAVGSLSIAKVSIQLADPSNSVTYGHSVPVSTRLTDGSGNPIPDRTVTFEVYYGGSWHSVGSDTTDSDGWASVTYTADLASGDYSLRVQFAGDAYYTAGSKTGILTINKESTELLSDSVFTSVCTDPISFRVRLRAVGGNSIEGRSVAFEVYYDGAWHQIGVGITNSTGYAVLGWTVNLASGTYDLRFSFAGDNYYSSSSIQSTLSVEKEIVVLGDPSTSVNYSDSIQITSRLMDDDGVPVSGATLEFYVYSDGLWNLVGSDITDGNGYASVPYTATLVPGTYDLRVDFNGDSYYNSGANTGSIVVNKDVSVISDPSTYVGYGDEMDIVVRLTDDENNPMAGDLIEFRVYYDGAWHDLGSNTTNASGYARLIQPCSLSFGSYNLEAAFAGSQCYLSAFSTGTLGVGKEITILSDPTTSGQYNELIPIWTRITDDENNPIADLNVTFWVFFGGDWHLVGWDLSNSSGYVQVNHLLDLAPGDYSLKVKFEESVNYLGSETPGTLTISKLSTQLVDPSNSITYGHSMDISTRLTDGSGKPVAGRMVTFEIYYGGSWHNIGSDTTDSEGWVSVAYIADLASGDYSLRVRFAGDAYYTAGSRFGVLTVNKDSTQISSDPIFFGVFTDSVSFVVQLGDAGGNPIAGRSVTFEVYFGGAWHRIGVGTTNSTGYAVLDWTVNLAPGTYNLRFSFAGDSYYQSAAQTCSLGVDKETVALNVSPTVSNYGDSAEIVSQLLDDDGYPVSGAVVTFYIYDGSWVSIGSAQTNGTGHASVIFDCDMVPGTYGLNASFAGDQFCYSAVGSGSITINREIVSVSSFDSDVNYSDSIVLGRILDDEGNAVAGVSSTVYAYYDGAWHEVGVATTDSDGWAGLNVFLSPGSYTVNVTFPGDAYYESGWQNATLTVHRESIVLEIIAPSSVYVDQTAQLGVRVTDDEGNAISGLYVEFYLNGALYANGTTNSSGELSADWTPLETATYSLEVRVSGGDNYVDGTATKSMSVVKPPPPPSSLPLLLLLVSQSAGGVSPVIILAAAGLVGIAIIALLIRAASRRGPVRWTPRY